MKQFKIGIQLYSVRDDLAADFEGTLRKVKEMGYEYVEFAGYFADKSGEEIKALLDEIGLKSISAHQNLDLFVNDPEGGFAFYKAYGVKYIVIPWYDSAKLPGTPAWEETKALFKKVADEAKKYGFEILYHNHDFEFETYEDRYLYDIMFEELKGYVNPQPDVCWLKYGGVEPAEYIRKYGDRINVVHLKDFQASKLKGGPAYALIDENGNEIEAEGGNANDFKLMPLGQGRNDFPAILAACEDIDAELLVVEQDNFTDITPFEGMAASRKYLKDTFGL